MVGFTAVLVGYLAVWWPGPTAGLSFLGVEMGEWLKFFGVGAERDYFYIPPFTLALCLVWWSLNWPNHHWSGWVVRGLALLVSLLSFPAVPDLMGEAQAQYVWRVEMIALVGAAVLLAAALRQWGKPTWLSWLPWLLMIPTALWGGLRPLWYFQEIRPFFTQATGYEMQFGPGVWLNTAGHTLIVLVAVGQLLSHRSKLPQPPTRSANLRPYQLAASIAFVAMVVAVFPPVFTPYDLTGEEKITGQAAAISQWLLTAIRPQPQLAPEVELTPQPRSLAGMNTFLQWEVEEAKRAEILRLLQENNILMIRQEFTWEDIEIHGKGDFVDRRNDPAGVSAWVKYDNIVDLAEKYQIEIIARLSNTPEWAHPGTAGTFAPPDNPTDYADFVALTVERYKGRIHYYQLWNEPNIYPEWGEQAVNPEQFTAMMCEAYHRAKAIDPQVMILSPALAQTHGTPDVLNMNDLLYLNRMYAAGAKDCFDILAVQAYGLYSGPTDRRLYPTKINVQRPLYHRDLLVHYGDEHKPVWVSEAGWNSLPADWPGFAQYGRVDEATKGRYAAELLERVVEEWPWVGVVNLWYLKRPMPDADQSYYFRLMEPDFTPLESWLVLTERLKTLPTAYVGDGLRGYRPTLFLSSLAIWFFATLQLLQWSKKEKQHG